jgi:hypothetical protein
LQSAQGWATLIRGEVSKNQTVGHPPSRINDVVSGWSQFAQQHWVIGGLVASLLWFFAGRQSFSNRKADFAMLWQSVAVLILLVLCGWAVAEQEWLGLAVAIVILYVELRSIRRIWATTRRDS